MICGSRKDIFEMEYGLIGGKLGHSYSKEIHEKLAEYTYELCPLTEEEFHQFMKKADFKAIKDAVADAESKTTGENRERWYSK